jgi:hypothetical protein
MIDLFLNSYIKSKVKGGKREGTNLFCPRRTMVFSMTCRLHLMNPKLVAIVNPNRNGNRKTSHHEWDSQGQSKKQ